jgi:hypothetical protein
MATIKQAQVPPANLADLIPVAPRAPISGPPVSNDFTGLNPSSVGPTPGLLTTAYDNVRQWIRPGTAQFRTFPLPVKANSQVNSLIKSTVEAAAATTPVATTGLKFRGTWNASTQYSVNDVVIFNKSTYLALQASANISPNGDSNPSAWQLLSENLFFNPSIPLVTQIRGFSTVSNSNTGVTINFPAGTIAGDLAVVFVAAAFSGWSSPSGWNVLNTSAGLVWNRRILSKVLTATDISTGSVTVNWGGNYYFSAGIVTFVGNPGAIRETDASDGTNIYGSFSLTTSSAVAATDGLIYWVARRTDGGNAAPPITLTQGSQLQYSNDAGRTDGQLSTSLVPASGAVTQTWGFSASPSQNVDVAIVVVKNAAPTPAVYKPYDLQAFDGLLYVCLKQTTQNPTADPTSWYQFLPASGVTAGSYTNTDLTVNSEGIITAASSGSSSAEVSSVNLTGQTADISATTAYSVPASGAGCYRVTVYMVISQAATSSSTLPDSQIIYTDEDSGATITIPITGALTTNTTSTFAQASFIINAKLSTNIQYAVGQLTPYASSGATAMHFAYRLRVEAS